MNKAWVVEWLDKGVWIPLSIDKSRGQARLSKNMFQTPSRPGSPETITSKGKLRIRRWVREESK